jgi:GNAT superfamily N-acetyltransferase
MIRVVQAGVAERDTVLALVEKLLRELEETPDEFEGIDRRRVERDRRAAGERFTAFLALNPKGDAVGVLTLFEAFAIYAGGNYGIIDEMYVEPEYRSRGVGGKLLQAVKDHGAARGWMRLDVAAPPEKRWERTVRFYEAQGFVFTGPKLRLRLGSGAP